jgi:membrane-associated phospholipid phosphatase
MLKKTIIPDIYASERSSRKKPFIATLFCYSSGIIALLLVNAPLNLIALLACYLVNSSIMMVISQFWKISIHASGISGPATFLTHQLGFGMMPFVLLILPISWARLKLKAHDVYQVTAGSLLAIVLTYVQLEIYLAS